MNLVKLALKISDIKPPSSCYILTKKNLLKVEEINGRHRVVILRFGGVNKNIVPDFYKTDGLLNVDYNVTPEIMYMRLREIRVSKLKQYAISGIFYEIN